MAAKRDASHALRGTSAGMRCGNPGDLLFTTACSAAEEAFDVCTGAHDNCSIEIHTDGSCKFECDQYAAMCTRVDAGSSCQCTYGPRNGAQFDSCDEDAVRALHGREAIENANRADRKVRVQDPRGQGNER